MVKGMKKKGHRARMNQWELETGMRRSAKTASKRVRSGKIHRLCTQNKYGGAKKYLKGPGGVIYRPYTKGFNRDGTKRKPNRNPPTAKQIAARIEFGQTWGSERKGTKGGYSGGANEYAKWAASAWDTPVGGHARGVSKPRHVNLDFSDAFGNNMDDESNTTRTTSTGSRAAKGNKPKKNPHLNGDFTYTPSVRMARKTGKATTGGRKIPINKTGTKEGLKKMEEKMKKAGFTVQV